MKLHSLALTCLSLLCLQGVGPTPPVAMAAKASVTTGTDPSAEAVTKLQALVQLDTTNPPGDETKAAALIASWLKDEGIESQLLESGPGRSTVIARLKGSGARKPLLLLNHLDVVTADAKAWKHPPFAGIVADGALWGRGSLDMKGLGVMELIAFLELKRRGVDLDRDVIFCATPDEEAGGMAGVEWLLRNHRGLVDCSEVLNEGGSGYLTPAGAQIVGIQAAERGVCWVKVTAKGTPGHGSVERTNGATPRLVRALARLQTLPKTYEVVPEAKATFQALAKTESGLRRFVLEHLHESWLLNAMAGRLIAEQPTLAPMIADTINITVLAAGDKVNVMPGEASAQIDMRMLPGRTVEEMLARVTKGLADPELDVTLIHGRMGSRSPASGPLFEALVAASQGEYPNAVVTEVLTPGGGTDSAFFRERGIAAYGLMPIMASAEQLASIHGDNEYIRLDQLAAGTRVIVKAVAQASRKSP